MKWIVCVACVILFAVVHGEIAIPAQDKIPVNAYMLSDCHLYVKSIGIDPVDVHELGDVATVKVISLQQGDVEIHLFHIVTLSTVTINDFLDVASDEAKKLLKTIGLESADWQVKKTGRGAIVEVPEFVCLNARKRAYMRIMRTVDGFAVVEGITGARKWEVNGARVRAWVNGARLMTETEIGLCRGNNIVRVDADGDLFTKGHGGYLDSSGVLKSERDYFLNPEKNRLQEAVELAEKNKKIAAENEAWNKRYDSYIRTFFGCAIGDVLGDRRNVRRMNNGSWAVKSVIRPKAPFAACKYITKWYTPNDWLLYRVDLDSEEYLNPDLDKMQKRMDMISNAIGEKFKDMLKMEKTERSYEACFFMHDQQELSVSLEFYVTELGAGHKARLRIHFENSDLGRNEGRSECLTMLRSARRVIPNVELKQKMPAGLP